VGCKERLDVGLCRRGVRPGRQGQGQSQGEGEVHVTQHGGKVTK